MVASYNIENRQDDVSSFVTFDILKVSIYIYIHTDPFTNLEIARFEVSGEFVAGGNAQ